jgi:hypothetical protein
VYDLDRQHTTAVAARAIVDRPLAREEDFATMCLAGLVFTTAPSFEEVMHVRSELQAHANETRMAG